MILNENLKNNHAPKPKGMVKKYSRLQTEMVVKTIVVRKTWMYVSKTYGVGSNPAAPAF